MRNRNLNQIKKAQNQKSTKADELSENNVKRQRERNRKSPYISHTAIKAYAYVFPGWSLSILCGGVSIEVVVGQAEMG